MNIKNIYILYIAAILISITSCSPNESVIQTAIAQTEIEQLSITPSLTITPQSTITPTFTLTLTPTETFTPTNTDIPIEIRILGTWSGAMTNHNGDQIPAQWTFMQGGIMIVEFPYLGMSYGAEWSIQGNRINIVTELDPNDPTYRDVEFISDDIIILSKEESGISETWTRVR